MPAGRTLRCGSASCEQLAEPEPVCGLLNVCGWQLVQGRLAVALLELGPAPVGTASAPLELALAPLEPALAPLELAPAPLESGLASVVELECPRCGY